MAELYCAAFLTEYSKYVSIPIGWIQASTNGAEINPEKPYTVFYAPDGSIHSRIGPDFSIARISSVTVFEEDTFGYFMARISGCFGKYCFAGCLTKVQFSSNILIILKPK